MTKIKPAIIVLSAEDARLLHRVLQPLLLTKDPKLKAVLQDVTNQIERDIKDSKSTSL